MKKKTKVIVSSALSIAVCASLIAGSTLALFSSEDDVNIAITSGKVDVKATIKENPGISSTLGDNTAMGTIKVEGNEVTLTNFTPGDYADIGITVTNYSTISAKWQLLVSLGEEGDETLYKTLSYSVTSEGHTDFTLINLANGNKETKWNSIDAATSEEGEKVIDFTFHVAFPEEAKGEELMEKTCKIILAVKAVQGNAHTADPVEAAYNVTEAADLTALKPEDIEEINEINLLDNIEVKEGETLTELEQITGFTGEFNGNGFSITYAGETDPTQFIDGLERGGIALLSVSEETSTPTVTNLTVRNASDFGKQAKWDKDGEMTYIYQVNSYNGLKKFRDLVNNNDNNENPWTKNHYPFKGEVVELTQDIDLNNEPWIRIGVDAAYKRFAGTFNGNGHVFTNVVVGKTEGDETVKDTGFPFGDVFNATPKYDSLGWYDSHGGLTADAKLNYSVRQEGTDNFECLYTWTDYTTNAKAENLSRDWYIRNADGLKEFRDSVNTKYDEEGRIKSGNKTYSKQNIYLMANIDLKGEEWTPIGCFYKGKQWVTDIFAGNFYGNGHTISNLKIFDTPAQAEYKGDKKYGNYQPVLYHFGGLFGDITGTVEDVRLEGVTISGFNYLGGVVGYVQKGATVKNCSVRNVNITFQRQSIEGVEETDFPKELHAGAIVGWYDESGANVIDCKGDATINVEMDDVTLNNIQCDNNGYITALHVTDMANFMAVAELITKNAFGLGETKKTTPVTLDFARGEYDCAEYTEPVSLNGFTVDGHGAVIKNLNITNTDCAGFFGSIANCTVKNFVFENATLQGNAVGVVAGRASQSTLENITVKGDIDLTWVTNDKMYYTSRSGIGIITGHWLFERYGSSTTDAMKAPQATLDCHVTINYGNIEDWVNAEEKKLYLSQNNIHWMNDEKPYLGCTEAFIKTEIDLTGIKETENFSVNTDEVEAE